MSVIKGITASTETAKYLLDETPLMKAINVNGTAAMFITKHKRAALAFSLFSLKPPLTDKAY